MNTSIAKKEQPCLFRYATSELSQDAFFAYLLAWSDSKYEGCPEHVSGKAFLQKMFEMNGKTMPEKISIKVHRQQDHMDIFCEINEKEFALIFEDKTSSLEHDEQLKRYWETVRGYGYKDESILGIYCKTYEISVENIDSRYHILDRKDLLGLLEDTRRHWNEIIEDFTSYLENIDNQVEGYKTRPHVGNDWDGLAWSGFFTAIRKKLSDCDGAWNYVPNASGGFMGFWWHWGDVEDGNVYLQLEEGKACFKVEVGDVDKAQELKFKWNKKIIEAGTKYASENINVVRPSRMRVGNYMTVAVLKDDYRVWKGEKLDLDATVENLKIMERVLDDALGDKGEDSQNSEMRAHE